MIKPVKKSVKVKIPVRADLAGGVSDIPYYLSKYQIPEGEVANITLPVYLTVEAEIGRAIDQISIEAPDINRKLTGDLIDLASQEQDNVSQIAHQMIRFFKLDSAGLKIRIFSGGQIPPASGLGTSSAAGVAVVRALSSLYGLNGVNAPEFSYLVDQSMKITCGKQDNYGSDLKGFNYLKFWGPGASYVTVIDHKNEKSKECKWLLDRITVYYSGQSRSSGKTNEQSEKIIAKDPKILSDLAKEAGNIYKAVVKQDENLFRKAIVKDRNNRLKISEIYYTDGIWKMAKVGEELGFTHRVCGAGNGGCLLFFGDPKKKKELIKKLSAIGGKVVY